ncbi:SMI1/KNR4 family protein [Bacillus sp. WMMC1349]|uniref:SMI1/KNR4 family protein n=1 Tax=Bacillus sp. WMMC1349 TaxID=2736254 RepID=UPI001557290D|nr:SMI1/KNR4 family protein [Bacillus sp. WMMC1349]NPC93411.1 SMI1/KNR4 family protein [Bacillus sp. WMMC1349]
MKHFIGATLNGLKKRLNEKNEITLFCTEGDSCETVCSFHEPASDKEIRDFEEIASVKLPSDYKAFLKLHNGADIFDLLSEGSNIGGGLHLFNLNQVNHDLHELTHLEEEYIPIAHLLEGSHLLIDQRILKKERRNYLVLFSGIDYEPLNLNFELFMDRYILSQGQNFWEWPIYTAENYYDLCQNHF